MPWTVHCIFQEIQLNAPCQRANRLRLISTRQELSTHHDKPKDKRGPDRTTASDRATHGAVRHVGLVLGRRNRMRRPDGSGGAGGIAPRAASSGENALAFVGQAAGLGRLSGAGRRANVFVPNHW